MTTAVVAEEAPAQAGAGASHYYCCNRNVALCGADLSEVPEDRGSEPIDCVVCVDLHVMQTPCAARCPKGGHV